MSKRKRKKQSSNTSFWLVIILAVFAFFFKGGDIHQLANNLTNQFIPGNSKTVKSVEDNRLSQLTFKSGGTAYVFVNNNKSDLNAKDWKQNQIVYGNLDRLNRTTQATGYLSRANLVKSNTRTSQTWNPTGWHQKRLKINGKMVEIQNRGHLLAYSITGKFDNNGRYNPRKLGSLDNPKNLATQTAFSNQQTMQIFEERVRNALAKNKKVIYKVSTVFKGNGLMPIGYHAEALSTDGTLNFNVFVWNVQPGVQFDYNTGRSRVDRSMTVRSN
ncbi:DNA/RNA non-specific endonuclease [Pediococcus stilesii]|uniref:DNA-entry nuclease n=1 Tax=Pediococcus stilesii TaxID=331679 RepID=A0A0R2KYM6_9LACO|nr:DNA/RNA non-specific endonuclease [Pediococcus stilesii]KRN94617.1 DNA-entry nuclease [Pediococcus stilesii]